LIPLVFRLPGWGWTIHLFLIRLDYSVLHKHARANSASGIENVRQLAPCIDKQSKGDSVNRCRPKCSLLSHFYFLISDIFTRHVLSFHDWSPTAFLLKFSFYWGLLSF
jgi:hypothetical protein